MIKVGYDIGVDCASAIHSCLLVKLSRDMPTELRDVQVTSLLSLVLSLWK